MFSYSVPWHDALRRIPLPPSLLPTKHQSQKRARKRAEKEARRMNDLIDEQLQRERLALQNKVKPVKVLLLGQSESGKSTLLKNFQLRYARQEWDKDRAAWRVVIFLNLISNAIHVLDVLAREMSLSDGDRTSLDYSRSNLKHSSHTHVYCFTDKHRWLKLRLAHLRKVQTDLEERRGHRNSRRSAFEQTPSGSSSEPVQRREEENYEIANILSDYWGDMRGLWEDPVVQQILAHREVHIEDTPGFFLNDIERISSADYKPSDDDIMRAQFPTVGVRKHDFVMEDGMEWIIYDVGGTRSSRIVWASFFDDVNAIIFLFPISCFDEKLQEDSKVNRLEGSYQLWRSVCSSPILARIPIILLLNKCDLLHKKLKRGVRVKDFIPSFGDRENDVSTVMTYFRFQISWWASPAFVHFTSVIDTSSMVIGIVRRDVKECILRTYLRSAGLL